MVVSRDQNARGSHNVKNDVSSFERVKQFKHLRKILTNKILFRKKLRSRWKSGNACCHSLQNRLSSSLLSKSIKIKIHSIIILPSVLYGCEIWSLA